MCLGVWGSTGTNFTQSSPQKHPPKTSFHRADFAKAIFRKMSFCETSYLEIIFLQNILSHDILSQSISANKVFVRKTLESAMCRSELCGEDSRSPRYTIQHPKERQYAISASVGQIRALQGFAKCGCTSAKSFEIRKIVCPPQNHLSSAKSFDRTKSSGDVLSGNIFFFINFVG